MVWSFVTANPDIVGWLGALGLGWLVRRGFISQRVYAEAVALAQQVQKKHRKEGRPISPNALREVALEYLRARLPKLEPIDESRLEAVVWRETGEISDTPVLSDEELMQALEVRVEPPRGSNGRFTRRE
jgi:hypothetical protein